jgi:hypothetical protein
MMNRFSKIISLFTVSIFLYTPVFGENLKSVEWFSAEKMVAKKRVDKNSSINVSRQVITAETVGALIRQSIVSLNLRLDVIKIKLNNGETLEKSEIKFLKDVSKQARLASYIDNDFWELIGKSADKGERWADEIITISGRKINRDIQTTSNKNYSNTRVNNSGLEVVEENGSKKLASKYNGLTQSVLSGYQGPDYVNNPASKIYFSPEGFNNVQTRFKRKFVSNEDKKKEYEKYNFGRKYVEDEAVTAKNDISSNLRVSNAVTANNQQGARLPSSLEGFDPSTFATKIIDSIAGDMSKKERVDFEASVSALLETTSSATADRIPASSASTVKDKNRRINENSNVDTEITSGGGGAGAHY